MAATPLVTVVIPTYNTADYTGAAIESVLAQTYASYEIIVVNDGSPDTLQLERVLSRFGDRVRYISQENQGVSAARNTGILAATTPFVAFLDSDDVWEPDYLAVQMAMFDADPSLDAIYPNARIFGDHPHAGRTFMDVCPSDGPVTFEAILTQRCNVFIGMVARRDVLVRAGLFDPALGAAEDFELWLRVVTGGGRMAYHRRPLVRFRKRRGSLSSDPVWMMTQALKAVDKVRRTVTLDERQRIAVERRYREFEAELALAEGKRAFFRLDAEAALRHLQTANATLHSARLSAICAVLRLAPRLLLNLYRWRDRLVLRSDTRF